MDVRPLREADRVRARAWLHEHWHESMAAHGELFFPAEHEGFVAGDWEGLITYRVVGGRCEVTLLKALRDGEGIGTALLDATAGIARDAGCRDVWLIDDERQSSRARVVRAQGFPRSPRCAPAPSIGPERR